MRAISLALAVLGLGASRPAAAEATAAVESVSLQVSATGFRSERGHAIARLYRPGESVLGEPWRTARSEIHGGTALLAFPGLPSGAYALVVFHDLNDNGKIDHNVLGLPAEPLGFSNGFALGLLSGKPTFDKLRFNASRSSASLQVRVQ